MQQWQALVTPPRMLLHELRFCYAAPWIRVFWCFKKKTDFSKVTAYHETCLQLLQPKMLHHTFIFQLFQFFAYFVSSNKKYNFNTSCSMNSSPAAPWITWVLIRYFSENSNFEQWISMMSVPDGSDIAATHLLFVIIPPFPKISPRYAEIHDQKKKHKYCVTVMKLLRSHNTPVRSGSGSGFKTLTDPILAHPEPIKTNVIHGAAGGGIDGAACIKFSFLLSFTKYAKFGNNWNMNVFSNMLGYTSFKQVSR